MSPRKKSASPKPVRETGVYTRRCLAEDLVESHPELNIPKAREIIQTMIAKLSGALVAGNDIQFREFGVLKPVTRHARPGRNPRKPGDKVIIPERVTVRFKIGRILKAALNPGQKISGASEPKE